MPHLYNERQRSDDGGRSNPYATERATCNVPLPSGSAMRCGLPVSVAGEHVGHGYR